MNGPITFHVQQDGDGWWACCPDLEGLFTSGETLEELFENMADAATAYLRSLIKHEEAIPIVRLTWEGV